MLGNIFDMSSGRKNQRHIILNISDLGLDMKNQSCLTMLTGADTLLLARLRK